MVHVAHENMQCCILVVKLSFLFSVTLNGDPANATIEIDRRMLDFCVGLDTEFSEIVEGSHLYYPKTKFEQVCVL